MVRYDLQKSLKPNLVTWAGIFDRLFATLSQYIYANAWIVNIFKQSPQVALTDEQKRRIIEIRTECAAERNLNTEDTSRLITKGLLNFREDYRVSSFTWIFTNHSNSLVMFCHLFFWSHIFIVLGGLHIRKMRDYC